MQDHLDRLADAADKPCGLERGLATMWPPLAEQCTKGQVSRAALKGACPYRPQLSLQVTSLKV
jgi:hypothetical protein